MPVPFSEPPVGSAITVTQPYEGQLSLSWPRPYRALVRWLWIFVVWPLLAGGAFAAVAASTMFIELCSQISSSDRVRAILIVFVACVFLGLLVAAAVVVAQLMLGLIRSLQPPEPERLILGRSALWYPPSTSSGDDNFRQGPLVAILEELDPTALAKLDPSTRAVLYRDETAVRTQEIPVTEVRAVHIEPKGGRTQLMVEWADRRLEIGPTLRPSDREWLARVIRAWMKAGKECH